MLKFADSGGQLFRARSYIGLVRSMRQSAWVAPGKQAYMQDVAKRIRVLDGGRSTIDTTNAETFVLSLEQFGWLHRIP